MAQAFACTSVTYQVVAHYDSWLAWIFDDSLKHIVLHRPYRPQGYDAATEVANQGVAGLGCFRRARLGTLVTGSLARPRAGSAKYRLNPSHGDVAPAAQHFRRVPDRADLAYRLIAGRVLSCPRDLPPVVEACLAEPDVVEFQSQMGFHSQARRHPHTMIVDIGRALPKLVLWKVGCLDPFQLGISMTLPARTSS